MMRWIRARAWPLAETVYILVKVATPETKRDPSIPGDKLLRGETKGPRIQPMLLFERNPIVIKRESEFCDKVAVPVLIPAYYCERV